MESNVKAALGDELHEACINGDLDAVKTILPPQKTADNPSKAVWSALLYTATSKDHADIVQYCLENGAHVTNDVMKILLINGAKKVYTLLLDTGDVDVNYYIPWFGDILGNVAVFHGDLEWTQLCLDHGADPNENLWEEHKSILAAAAENASLDMVKLLVEQGKAYVESSGAIVMAAQEGKLDMVEYLLRKGADIDEIGIEHPTDPRYKEDMGSALHRAVQAGHEDVVQFLIDSGANVMLRDPIGRTPLSLAQAGGNYSILVMLEACME
ncbi:MAG: hypothetical protein Q9218_008241 [Villophora microphyllina]